MKIERIRIESYSGFEETDWIDLSPGLNVVAGRNNSGKSSFLRACSLEPGSNPHKNEVRYLEGDLRQQRISYEILVRKDEFRERLSRLDRPVRVTLKDGTRPGQEALIEELSGDVPLRLKYSHVSGNSLQFDDLTFDTSKPQNQNMMVSNLSMSHGEPILENEGRGRSEDLMPMFVGKETNAIFYLPSERYHVAKTGLGRHKNLDGDTRNLAGFLQYIQGNFVVQFDQIEENLRRVIPSVDRITIDTLQDGFQILVWPQGSSGNRSLAMPLEACGTGVSQILAIFAIVATRSDSVVIVDEINSFLHPKAVKDLLSILVSDYGANQYIISTHSSDVLSHPSVDRIFSVKRENFTSRISSFSRSDLARLKESLMGLGVSMGDVLGAEKFLWVEGPTEEIVIPNLIREHLGGVPKGLQVSSVSATADFESKAKDKRAIVRIYEHVSKKSAPLGSAGAFLLDRESLNDASVENLPSQTDNKLRVLARRSIENYVLKPELLHAVLAEELGEDAVGDIENVRLAMIESALGEGFKTRTKFKENFEDESWLAEVFGAKLIEEVFAKVSENKLEFRKTLHTPRLFAHAKKEEIAELLEIIEERMRHLDY